MLNSGLTLVDYYMSVSIEQKILYFLAQSRQKTYKS